MTLTERSGRVTVAGVAGVFLEVQLTQSPDGGDDLLATLFCKDPGSVDMDDCAAFYRTDRRTWIVQGKRRGARVATQLRALGADETFLEIPEPLVELFVRRYVKERYGTDLGNAAE